MRQIPSFILRRALVASIAAPLVAAANPAGAQAGAEASRRDDDAIALEPIAVTARRREESLQDVPVAVTAFDEDAIETLDLGDLGELDAFVPNLTIYAARGSSSTVTAYLRGIGQSDPLWGVDPGVGIYVDDVYLARPQGALLDLVDVERIEVLRGPQGTLYGKNTIGGAIRIVTKPLEPELASTTRLTLGSYDELDLETSVNAPLGSDALVGRFAFASLNRDGYGENRADAAPVSDEEVLVARGSVGLHPGGRVSIVLSGDWLDDQSGVRGGMRLNPFNPFDPDRAPPFDHRYDIESGMRNVNDTTLHGYAATATFTLSDTWWLKSITAYRESDTDTTIDFDMLADVIADVRGEFGDVQRSQELQLHYAGQRLAGVLGFYGFDGEAGGTVYNNFRDAAFTTTRGTVDTGSVALYGEGTWRFDERWSLTAGARWTDETKAADVLNQSFRDADFDPGEVVATPADFEDEVRFTDVSPKLSLDWRAREELLVYALGARGFKSGGFNIRANAAAVPRSALPFGDERVTSFELGTKAAFAGGRLQLNAAAFHNDYEDIQLSVFSAFDSDGDGVDDAFFGDFTNAGRGTIAGLELELAWRVTDALRLYGNAAWLDAAYDEFIDRGVDVSAQQAFTNAPERSATLTAEYAWRAFGGALAARATAAYQSEVIPTTDLSPEIAQPGYTVFDAGLVWRSDATPWTLSLQGRNLGDKAYRTTGYNVPVLGILAGFYGPPREVSLTAAYAF